MGEREQSLLDKLQSGQYLTDSEQSEVLKAIMSGALAHDAEPYNKPVENEEIRLVQKMSTPKHKEQIRLVSKLSGNSIDLEGK